MYIHLLAFLSQSNMYEQIDYNVYSHFAHFSIKTKNIAFFTFSCYNDEFILFIYYVYLASQFCNLKFKYTFRVVLLPSWIAFFIILEFYINHW